MRYCVGSISKSGCPACTSSLFLTYTFSTLPATSAATGTTKAWTLAWEVYGVRRSETKYHARLRTISTSTTIAPPRLPLPGLGGGGGGGGSLTGGGVSSVSMYSWRSLMVAV